MKSALIWGLAYLLGAIPFGVLIARSQKINIQNHGSGNIGATNIARIVGKKAGLLTLVGDCAKGMIAVAIASATLDNNIQIAVAALMAFLGHLFSIFLKFKGGKGVATGLGVFLYLMPPATLSAMVVFATVMAVSRYVSTSSILAALSLPLFGFFYQMPTPYIYTSAIISGLVILRHHKNIQRLLAGTETKFGQK
ncbi:MAG: acyl-phosphate glycerol 3-phosphate acyltransferase [Nitrospinae bacterium RIFCSPLOWO2_12_FULL_47_7]|nr:MAG: acyl-phosphate glycerol 3-phosphate acyltransferase [Nitrospinae bacterium RIFCSPLOWO2_12_FULL_47_7]